MALVLCCVIARRQIPSAQRRARKCSAGVKTPISMENFQATCANCIRRDSRADYSLFSIWGLVWLNSVALSEQPPPRASSIWYAANVLGSVSAEGLDCRLPRLLSSVDGKKKRRGKSRLENSGGGLTSQTWTDAFSRRFRALLSAIQPHSRWLRPPLWWHPRQLTAKQGPVAAVWHLCNWQRVRVSQRVSAS